MVVNDPIADMLTRIRNAQVAKHDSVTMPASNMKKAIAKILLEEGYIKSFECIDDGLQGNIKINLKYLDKQQPVIVASPAGAFTPAARTCRRCLADLVSRLFPPARV